MEKIDAICALLCEKTEYFCQYEQATYHLLNDPIERLEEHLSTRERLIGSIDETDKRLDQLTGELGELAGKARLALQLGCKRTELPDCLWPIFDKALSVFAVVNRIHQNEPLIADRLEEELEQLTQKIKQTNRSVSAQAARYGAGLTSSMPGGLSRKA